MQALKFFSRKKPKIVLPFYPTNNVYFMDTNIVAYNEKQIAHLLQLQQIEEKLARLEELRGDLPVLVTKLVDSIEATRRKKKDSENRLEDYKKAIEDKQVEYKACKDKVKTYEKQQKEASNDQEYKLLTKRMELEKLDVLLAQKKVKEYQNVVAKEKIKIDEFEKELNKQEKILAEKKKTLEAIDRANEVKLADLEKKREKTTKGIDVAFYDMYQEIRESIKQEVLVNVVDDACRGCFIIIPPQQQVHVMNREQIIHCENCHRVLAYVKPTKKEEEVPKKAVSRRKTQASRSTT